MKRIWQQFSFYLTMLILIAPVIVTASPVMDRAWKQIELKQFNKARDSLKKWLDKSPHDVDVRYLYARTLAWNKNIDEALIEMTTIIKIQPENSDFLLSQATFLSWKSRSSEAIKILRRARDISPGFKSLWNLELKLLAAASKDKTAFQKLQHNYFLQFLEKPQQAVKAIQPPQSRQQLMLGYGFEKPKNGTQNWQSIIIDYQNKKHNIPYGVSLEHNERFGDEDQQLSFNTAHGYRKSTNLLSSVGLSSNQTLFPEWYFIFDLNYKFKNYHKITTSWQHRKYPEDIVDTSGLKYTHYWKKFAGSFKTSITTKNNNLFTPHYAINIIYFKNEINFFRFAINWGNTFDTIDNKIKLYATRFIGINGKLRLTQAIN